jgi:hypothetical protein
VLTSGRLLTRDYCWEQDVILLFLTSTYIGSQDLMEAGTGNDRRQGPYIIRVSLLALGIRHAQHEGVASLDVHGPHSLRRVGVICVPERGGGMCQYELRRQ